MAQTVRSTRSEPFLLLMEALLSTTMNIVKWAMFLAPLTVFGLMAQLVMRVGFDTLQSRGTHLFL
ncbi:cation:dicarboxylate symporter family transporter [Ruegeria profundi]|uniref:cation:dicarboxylate symporter family transporter n=1 Tax=Ruegeria profundi TaxID=1685378 RepID=UPI001CD591D2|nr:dicarboxylate/amino acid:cation symporter [Ruegeria profundi]